MISTAIIRPSDFFSRMIVVVASVWF